MRQNFSPPVLSFCPPDNMEIVLDSTPKGRPIVYHPGDKITGKLMYNARAEQKVLYRMTLALEVRGFITADPTSLDVARIDLQHQLFYDEVCLFDGPFTVKYGLVWPFHFTVPTTYEYGGRKWLLPPSFSQVFPGTHLRAAFCVMIQYNLRATVIEGPRQQSLQLSKSLTVQQTSKKLPDSKQASSRIPMTHCHSRDTLCRHVKEKLQVFFNVVGRPHAANFHATLSFPKTLFRGQAGTICINVQKGLEGPSMREPILVLQAFRARLQGTLHTISEREVTREYGTFHSRPNVRLSLHDKPTTVISDISIDSFAQGNSFLPDFYSVSPYVQHTHFVDVEIAIVEEGTGNTFLLSGRAPVKVLPPLSDEVRGGR